MQREEAEEARTAVRARRRGGAPWYHEYAWSTLLRHVLRDTTARTLNKMVREAQLAQYNYILVVGAQEAENGTVNVRTRDNAVHGTKSVDDLIAEFKRLDAEKSPDPKPPEPKAAEAEPKPQA